MNCNAEIGVIRRLQRRTCSLTRPGARVAHPRLCHDRRCLWPSRSSAQPLIQAQPPVKRAITSLSQCHSVLGQRPGGCRVKVECLLSAKTPRSGSAPRDLHPSCRAPGRPRCRPDRHYDRCGSAPRTVRWADRATPCRAQTNARTCDPRSGLASG